MKRKLFSILTALALCLSLCPAPARAAEGGVASVTVDGTTTYYSTLEDAYEAAAAASSATVTLLDNVAVERTIVARQGNVTLNLNGKTITGQFRLSTGSSLTVRGSGTITSNGTPIQVEGGTLTVDGGTIETTSDHSIFGATTIYVASPGTAAFHGGHIISPIGEKFIALGIGNGATAEIDGGTFTGGIKANGTGTAELRGGVFENGGSDTCPSVSAGDKAVSTLLDQTDGTRYAYYKDGKPVAPSEQTKLLGTITVKKCTHEGVEITKNEDGSHSLDCPYCGASYTHGTPYTAEASGNVITVSEGCEDESCGYKASLGSLTVTIPKLAYGELDKKITWDTSKLENWTAVAFQIDKLTELPVTVKGAEDRYPPQTLGTLTENKLLDAGEHTLTVTIGISDGDGKQTVSCELPFTVDPAELKPDYVVATNREYEKGNRAVALVGAGKGEEIQVFFPADTTGTVSSENAGVYDKVTLAQDVKDSTGNYIIPAGTYQVCGPRDQTEGVMIIQASYEGLSEVNTSAKAGTTGTYDFTSLLQGIDGAVLGETSIVSGETLFDGEPTVSGNILTYKLKADAAVGSTGQIGVLMTSTNYRNIEFHVTVTVTDKDVPALTVSPITVTYTGEAVPASAIQGTAKVGNTTVPGTWAFAEGQALINVADSGVKAVKFTPEDEGNYAAVETTVIVTINKATPAGAPTYTAISAGGKTLADAGLTKPAGWPEGVLSWNLSEDTAVTANMGYEWTFTPEDTANYNVLTGSITLWVQNTGGGSSSGNSGSSGGGSGSSGGGSQTTLPVTTTGQNSAAVTTTTTAVPSASTSGGTATVTVDTSMGSEIVKQAVANNSETVVIAPKVTGSVTRTEVSIPASTVGQLGSRTGASLTVSTPVADVTIPNGGLGSLSSPGGDVTVTAEQLGNRVELTVTAGGRTVEQIPGGLTLTVPAENTAPGTVAVLVNPDGTREVVRKSAADEGSVSIPLEGSARLELVDNSKPFADVPGDSWAAAAAAFVSARELFSGTAPDRFSPDAPMSRGMLAVVLHNLENNPAQPLTGAFADVDNSQWYAEGVSWAAAKGIVSGYGSGQFGPNDNITREQLAVMLWRYAGSPACTNKELRFNDAGEISGFALEAMGWAVENGVINGCGNGQLVPRGLATRAQAAQMLMNFLKTK